MMKMALPKTQLNFWCAVGELSKCVCPQFVLRRLSCSASLCSPLSDLSSLMCPKEQLWRSSAHEWCVWFALCVLFAQRKLPLNSRWSLNLWSSPSPVWPISSYSQYWTRTSLRLWAVQFSRRMTRSTLVTYLTRWSLCFGSLLLTAGELSCIFWAMGII